MQKYSMQNVHDGIRTFASTFVYNVPFCLQLVVHTVVFYVYKVLVMIANIRFVVDSFFGKEIWTICSNSNLSRFESIFWKSFFVLYLVSVTNFEIHTSFVISDVWINFWKSMVSITVNHWTQHWRRSSNDE